MRPREVGRCNGLSVKVGTVLAKVKWHSMREAAQPKCRVSQVRRTTSGTLHVITSNLKVYDPFTFNQNIDICSIVIVGTGLPLADRGHRGAK